MEALKAQLAHLSIAHDLVDVTAEFRELARGMKPESVIKAPSFDLFEGTHSLEIDNVKLDSSLLVLTHNEEGFDCTATHGDTEEEKAEFVTAVVDRLCRSIVLWLNEFQTLPTTLLSCRYVEQMMCRFTEDPCSDFSTYMLETGHDLFDQVLSSCVIGTCYFVKLVQKLFRAGVVFEEEDLNCNTMGLNMLSNVQLETVVAHLDLSQQLVKKSYPNSRQLALLVDLLTQLVELHKFLPTADEISAPLDLQPLHTLTSCAEQLQTFEINSNEIYRGAFSAGIQKRLSNQFPPRDIVSPRGSEYKGFIEMARDLLLVISVEKARTITEIAQFSRFFNRTKQRHVLARAFFPLYLMRDDQTVLNQYTFNDFSLLHLTEFSFCSTSLSKALDQEPDESILRQKFEDFLQEISSILFEWYQTTSQNHCRYRQGYNRQLLLWDSLQAQIETYELELEGQGVRDELDKENSFMPLTTWVFYMKLRAMSDFVLKGFELDIYKPWEFFSMFWYNYYLSQHLENNLNRVSKSLDAKMNSISSLNKKLKKLKAGEKKEKLREAYRSLMGSEMPVLTKAKDFVEYSSLDCIVMKNLSLVEVCQFAILKSCGLIDSKGPISAAFSSPEWVHRLRFKTFASIGVPELPSYTLFQQSLQEFLIAEPMFGSKLTRSINFMLEELEKVKEFLTSIMQDIKTEGDAAAATQLVLNESLDYYHGLYRSAEALMINARTLRTKVGGGAPRKELVEKYTVEVSRPQGGSPYFPVLILKTKST
ncbi:LAME_0G13696g1_1 [Lachancea meyersii CBS 8951]|uniref:LAME_0G13696g1_1 n=1 Tax=Lachancea meyersii CBS 8951 TaxID=1266667 RepID=A0A1G4KAA8_9SACH|nr:LAME_0G13696g1_1 [Lachancea meyersii CBS 8951]